MWIWETNWIRINTWMWNYSKSGWGTMWQLILPSKDKLSGLRWSQMELDGPSWSEMVPNGLRNEMVPDRTRWSQMFWGGQRWWTDSLRWSQIIANGPRWSEILVMIPCASQSQAEKEKHANTSVLFLSLAVLIFGCLRANGIKMLLAKC